MSHVRAHSVLVVAGEARRASRGTIRPLCFQENASHRSSDGSRLRPRVYFKGKRVRYLITLRPLFFRRSTVEQRIETILHELYHASQAFDGTLDPERRHRVMPQPEFRAALVPMLERYLLVCPPEIRESLAFDGEVLVRQWLEKPSISFPADAPRKYRRRFSEVQTFLGPVQMITQPSE